MIEPVVRYLNQLVRDFRLLDSRGVMQMSRIVEMDLGEVFIPLKLKVQLPEREGLYTGSFRPDFGGSAQFRYQISGSGYDFEVEHSGTGHDLVRFPSASRTDLTLSDLLAMPGLGSRNRRWVVLGDPGAGKTTLLRHHTLHLAEHLLNPETQNGFFPIFITLRYFGEWLAKHPERKNGDALLDYWVDEGLAEFGLTDAADRRAVREYIDNNLRQGWVMFLLDGLDEQRDAATKADTAEAIRVIDRRYHGNSWLVTSRIVGYGGVLSGLFDEATVQPFSKEDRDAFLKQWFLAVERREDPVWLLAQRRGEVVEPDEFTRSNAARKADALIAQIDQIPGIQELAANPLLCTIVGLIFLQGGTLPESRAELYKLCVDTFIFNWEMHKRRKPQEGAQLNREETQAVLEVIALHFHEHCPENRAGRVAIVGLVENYLAGECGENRDSARTKAEHLLDLITEVAGLLIDRGNNEFGFFHLSFQEYLAARRMTGARRRWRDYLSRFCFDPRWREVVRLAAMIQGGKDAESGSEFVEAVWHVEPAPPHDDIMQYRFRFAFLLMRETRIEKETANSIWKTWSDLFFERFELACLWHSVLNRSGKLQPCPDFVVEQLLKGLADDERLKRALSIRSISLLNDARFTEGLIKALGDSDPYIGKTAIETLISSRSNNSKSCLLFALENRFSRIRAGVVKVLGNFFDKSLLEVFYKILEDRDADVRAEAVYAIAKLKISETVDFFLKYLRDKDAKVRKAAAESISEFCDNRIDEALLLSLDDYDPDVRIAVAAAIAKYQPERALSIWQRVIVLDKSRNVRSIAVSLLGQLILPGVEEQLLEMAKSNDYATRSSAFHALANRNSSHFIELCLTELNNPDSEMGESVAWALLEYEGEEKIPALMLAMKHRKENIRLVAIGALGRLKEPKAINSFIDALEDQATYARVNAAWALGEIDNPGASAILALEKALQDKESLVYGAAIRALGKLGVAIPVKTREIIYRRNE